MASKMDDVSSPSLAYMVSSSSFNPEKCTYIWSEEIECIIFNADTFKIICSELCSDLEAEMYQLSHLLAEQRSLLKAQEEMSLFGNKDSGSNSKPINKEEKSISSIEAVEGLSNIIDMTDLQCIYEGGLLEIDTSTYLPKQKIRAFLLHDSMIIASIITNRRGPVRYKFQALFELENVAVVNLKSSEGVKDAFKILLFPETHLYQAESAQAKNDWLNHIEECKISFKLKLEQEVTQGDLERQEGDMNPFEVEDEDDHDTNPFKSTESSTSAYNGNPFLEDETNPFLSGSAGSLTINRQRSNTSNNITENAVTPKSSKVWLRDLPEDLDVCIAQRDFEKAMELIDKTNSFLKESSNTQALKEIKVRLDHRVKQLVEALIEELDCHQSILLHGGPRATRRAVSLLVRLGRATEACQLFLRNRSEAIKQSLRQLKIEGATALYISKLSSVFFMSLIETGREFQKSFVDNSGFCSAFVVWANTELQNFVSRFTRQVFHRNIGLAAIGVCVGIATENCDKLNEIGLDLKFSMQHMLLKELMEALFDCRDQLVAAARQRATEEQWQPQRFERNHERLTNLVGEMESCGIKEFGHLVIDDCQVNLSSATVAFTKSVIGFLEDGLRVNTPELHGVLVECVADLFKNQVLQFEATLKSSHFKAQRPFIIQNAEFVLETILPIVKKKLKRQTGHDPTSVTELSKELTRLQNIAETR
ncbi:predicted protein [Nematostella vectensis]|uniref:Exocyst complex component 8 n=1 Tax=Nematostella vectensis TaxID=45351 RepID=A7RL74_NEMVE|nr:predicted protein [Nematostella vectensis]|eukprot:XP_001639873.1 predicted protein [Nematostella vectensis]